MIELYSLHNALYKSTDSFGTIIEASLLLSNTSTPKLGGKGALIVTDLMGELPKARDSIFFTDDGIVTDVSFVLKNANEEMVSSIDGNLIVLTVD